ncbi:MAG TPA: PLP-dependent aminotransferase family protein [Brevibacterium ravenspurgense]|nr:PLP-dependent aminotransferase family protein [Brevibacterium ravenspurgense]
MTDFRSALNRHLAGIGASPIRKLFDLAESPDIISFAGGHPDPELFDVEGIREAANIVLDTIGGDALQYGSTMGESGMLAAAARELSRKGLPTEPEDVVITSGSQQGLGLIAQTLFNEGDVLLVENPTYMSAIQAFGLQGVNFQPVRVDEDGADPDHLAEQIRKHQPRGVYLIPTFQNPTGVTMPESRRKQVADIIAESETWLIEDDPYSALWFDEISDLLPISADPRLADRSLLCNTVSKTLSPGLRVGWVRGPRDVLSHIGLAKQGSAMQTGTLDQLITAQYLDTTDLDAKIAVHRASYKQRMETMLEVLGEILPEGSEFNRPTGGMFIWVRLPEGYRASEMVYSAIEHGTIYVPGKEFHVADHDDRTLRLSFVSHTPEVIREGLSRLVPVFEKYRAQG